MFYSHFILAKKGPLGTVWMAAHLQHKLKKSQVAETNISASVSSIMFPEVPIALRLSGHLLLGVVRIYSRKVDYLYHDCNEVLTKLRYAFASVLIDLPEEATTAPFHSITIPETLELDAFEIDETIDGFTRISDDHIKIYEEITMQDQVTGEEEFASFRLDEERFSDIIVDSAVPEFGPRDMDIDSHSHPPVDGDIRNNVEEHNHRQYEDDAGGDNSEREILRHGVHVSPDLGLRVDEHEEQGKITEEAYLPDYQFPEDVTLQEIPTPAAAPSVRSPGPDPALISLGASSKHEIPVALRVTPPGQKPAAKSRKRRHHFDEVIVLSNTLMKKQLDDTRNLRQKRKRAPETAASVLQAYRNYSAAEIFNEPLVSGMCTKLQELVKRRHFAPRTGPSSRAGTSTCRETEIPLVTPSTGHDFGQLRDAAECSSVIPETFPLRDFSHLESATFEEYVSESRFDPERELPASSIPAMSGFDTSIGDGPLLSPPEDTPEFRLRHPPEELDCLKADSSQTGTTENGIENWSVRTRAVARYLRNSLKGSLDSPGKLNIKKILEGRTRKECARLFFEVLVLKSRGCIEVDQENPYDEVTLFLAPGFASLTL